MKFRTDKDVLKFIGISLGAILIGLLIFIYIESISIFGFILILSGLMGLVIAIIAASKPRQELIDDERSIRVREKAGYHAFWALLFISAIIILLRMLKLSPSLTPSIELTDGIRHVGVIVLWIFIVLRWYYNKKGVDENQD